MPPIPSSLVSVSSLSLPSPATAAMSRHDDIDPAPHIQKVLSDNDLATDAAQQAVVVSATKKHEDSTPSTAPGREANFLKVLSSTEDEEQLFNSWKMITRTKGILNEGDRMENASWRRWFQKKNNIKLLSPKDTRPSCELAHGGNAAGDAAHADSKGSASPGIHGILKSTLKKNILPPDMTANTEPSAQTDTGDFGEDGPRRETRSSLLEVNRQPWELERRRLLLPGTGSSKKKAPPKKRTVTFNEGLNKTTYVSYASDKWDDSPQEMLINVDELSRLRHSRLNGYQVRLTDADLSYFMEFKDSSHINPPSPRSSAEELLRVPVQNGYQARQAVPSVEPGSLSPLMPRKRLNSMALSSAPPPALSSETRKLLAASFSRDDGELIRAYSEDRLVEDCCDDLDDDFDRFWLFVLVMEILLFIRWCAGMAFVYPGTFGI